MSARGWSTLLPHGAPWPSLSPHSLSRMILLVDAEAVLFTSCAQEASPPLIVYFAFFARLLEVLVLFWPLVRLSAVFNNLPTHGANMAIIGTPVVSFGFLIHGIVYTHCLSNTRANKVSFYCLLFALVSKHFIVL